MSVLRDKFACKIGALCLLGISLGAFCAPPVALADPIKTSLQIVSMETNFDQEKGIVVSRGAAEATISGQDSKLEADTIINNVKVTGWFDDGQLMGNNPHLSHYGLDAHGLLPGPVSTGDFPRLIGDFPRRGIGCRMGKPVAESPSVPNFISGGLNGELQWVY
jgi:hypothetical protein